MTPNGFVKFHFGREEVYVRWDKVDSIETLDGKLRISLYGSMQSFAIEESLEEVLRIVMHE